MKRLLTGGLTKLNLKHTKVKMKPCIRIYDTITVRIQICKFKKSQRCHITI